MCRLTVALRPPLRAGGGWRHELRSTRAPAHKGAHPRTRPRAPPARRYALPLRPRTAMPTCGHSRVARSLPRQWMIDDSLMAVQSGDRAPRPPRLRALGLRVDFVPGADGLDPVRRAPALPPRARARFCNNFSRCSSHAVAQSPSARPLGRRMAAHPLTDGRGALPHPLAGCAQAAAPPRGRGGSAQARRVDIAIYRHLRRFSTPSSRRAAGVAAPARGLLLPGGRRLQHRWCSGDRPSHRRGRGGPRRPRAARQRAATRSREVM